MRIWLTNPLPGVLERQCPLRAGAAPQHRVQGRAFEFTMAFNDALTTAPALAQAAGGGGGAVLGSSMALRMSATMLTGMGAPSIQARHNLFMPKITRP